MFENARLTLTLWYLLIIMTISILFSGAIYVTIDREYQRFERGINEGRVLMKTHNGVPQNILVFNEASIREARAHLVFVLLVTNGVILVLSGAAGYFLAGRTLSPIKQMVDDQNRFLQDASHELRTPLTALRVELEVYLQQKNLTSDVKKLVQSNLEEVINLQKLSDSLLSLVNNIKQTQTRSRVSLKGALAKAIKRVEPLRKKKQQKIYVKKMEGVILAHEDSITDLFVILLDNAIKYSPEKSRISINSKKQNRQITLSFSDEGIGIDPHDAKHIFDRFYRVRKSRSKEFVEGFGLGLSIAKRTVESYNGTITVKKNPPGGSTFLLSFPLTYSD